MRTATITRTLQNLVRRARRRPHLPLFRVYTWDCERQKFTPQRGVPSGPYTQWGLKQALRALQQGGYPCHRGDNFVLVERAN